MHVTVHDTNRFGDLLVTVLTSEWGGYDTWVLRLDHARTGEVSPP